MALLDNFRAKEVKKLGVIALADNIKNLVLQEEFKGEIIDEQVTFPKELGAVHPFNFEVVEKFYKKFGYLGGIIDKYVDGVIPDFNVKVENENAQAVLDEFIKRTNFKVICRAWLREALLKGNGFMELDLENTQTRVLNANNMYVKRDNKANVKYYNQYNGDIKNFNKSSKKLTTFEPRKIAHLKINEVANEPYGIGLVYPNMTELERLLCNLSDMQKLVGRKAGAPYHVKVGMPGEAVSTDAINQFQTDLQFLNNRTEWVTDANVDIKLLDFGDIGKNFETPVNTSKEIILGGFQVPAVLMGVANIPEGLADNQDEAFKRRCKSIRDVVGKVMEESIFGPLLQSQKNEQFDLDIEIEFELPSEEDINARIEKISSLLGMGVNISENMRRMLQIELANAMGLRDAEKFLQQPEVGLDDQIDEEKKQMQQDMMDKNNEDKDNEGKNSPEAKKEEKIKQPEVPGAKPSTEELDDLLTESKEIREIEDLTVSEYLELPLKEIKGFNYSEYQTEVIKLTKKDTFETLRALNEMDIDLGLLDTEQVNKLKIILKDGFKKNKTMRDIELDIRDSLGLRDRYIIKDGNRILINSAEGRPSSIARTEVVRLSNLALNETYKNRGVEKVRWLAAVSDRTCDICMGLNGQVFGINEGERPPAHTNCRCSTIPVILE